MKKTPFGLIPDDWRIGDLADAGKVVTGSTPPTADTRNYGNDYPFVTPKEVGVGRYVGETSRGLSTAGGKKARLLPAKSVVFVCIGSTIGKVSQISLESASNQQINAITCNGTSDPGFLYYQLDFRAPVIRRLAGTQAVPIISKGLFEQVPLLFPPLAEQKNIAKVLGACDEAIEGQEQLIAQKQQRQKGLMEKLLVGEVRFPKFERTPWKKLKLGSVLKHVFRPISWSPEMPLKLVSIRRRAGGLFLRPEMKGADYKTSDLHEIRGGDFLISKRQVTHGALAVVKKPFDSCHVSKEYTIFENIAPKVLHTPFLDWLSKTREMWHQAYVASNGVAIEKLIFVPKDFLKFEIKLPPTIEEQSRIALFLNEQEQEIVLSQKRLEALKQQKKGLMQQLLTGKVRVEV